MSDSLYPKGTPALAQRRRELAPAAEEIGRAHV
jgi:hypothetical protein